MSEACLKQKSPRHGFVFSETPTIKGSMYGGSVTLYSPQGYGAILDCLFEMTDQVAASNGVTLNAAMETVLKDEGWRILPKHKTKILQALQENTVDL